VKWDGVDLSVLRPAFERIAGTPSETKLAEHVRAHPTGGYARRLWFLFEFLTQRTLDIPDASGGRLTPVLDPDAEFTSEGIRSTRHRVFDNLLNLLGNREFCPQVSRTPALDQEQTRSLAAEVARIVTSYDEDTLRRSIDYLFTKETRSSFAIEREAPSSERTLSFVRLLREMPALERITKADLIRLQRETVDPRFANGDWRTEQIYVGGRLAPVKRERYFGKLNDIEVASLEEVVTRRLLPLHARLARTNA
jgi:hypothetical protein